MTTPPLTIHFIAIGGTGMAPLACLLHESGHYVQGSDQALYPPMSTLLADAGIVPMVGFDPAHLDPRPDLVIVGNAVPRDNSEALETERLGLERISMPEALARFFLDGRYPLVVAGTHGKTTTTALTAWVYRRCGVDPGFLIGGVPLDLGRSFERGSGDRFIIEGDEYNAAYFDRGPKFLHYRPETLLLTSAEYDHADLYPEPALLTAAYQKLVALLPESGLIVACGDLPEVRRVVEKAPCRVAFYGLDSTNDVHPANSIQTGPWGSRFQLRDEEVGEVEIQLQLVGEHNVCNALAVWVAARRDGLPAAAVAAALSQFRGVRRRLEVIGSHGGVTVIDDFAHHPTAVRKTLAALRARYPGHRLLVAFEPRSLTAGRNFLYAGYLEAFQLADRAFIAPIFHAKRLSDQDRLDLPQLTEALELSGTPTIATTGVEDLLFRLTAETQTGDVVVTMSSGSFDDLPRRLLDELRRRNPEVGP